ncbi:hypothetical protein LJB84_00180 [Bacteroidales bacterium OttesenSCG-928-J19]|nr:hypothetical protein [Bacteroidales bacterium OttesenSCG-928-J19]
MKRPFAQFGIFWLSGFILLWSGILSSCTSAKSVEATYHDISSELAYDLTTTPYPDERETVIALHPIQDLEMETSTTVKRKSRVVLPFIFINTVNETYRATLGQQHYNQSYAQFLTDALLAECNRSASFYLENLEEAKEEADYFLNIEVIKNKTTGKLKAFGHILFSPEDLLDISSSYEAQESNTELVLLVRLTDSDRIVYEQEFAVKLESKASGNSQEYMIDACIESVELMSERLSEATKQIVEEIKSHLSLFVLSQSPR